MRYAGQRNSLAEVQTPRKQALMAFVPVNRTIALLHGPFEMCLELIVRFEIVRRVRKHNFPIPVDRHAIVRVRQVLGSEPEIERMLSHQLKREPRRNGGRAGAQHYVFELSHERNWSHRILEVSRT